MSSRRLARDGELGDFIGTLEAGYAVLGMLGGGSVHRQDGLLMVAGPHPHSLIANTAIRSDQSVPANGVLGRTREHYGAMGWAFDLATFVQRDADIDAAARAEGWELSVELPCMVIRRPPAPEPVPPNASVRRATGADDHRVVGSIVADCFADTDARNAGLRALFAAPSLIAPSGWPFIVASLGADDAAVASWFVRDGVGVVGFVATLPAYRRRGLGTLVTRLVTIAAFEAGARLVGLQASPEGRPVYAGLGYETIADSTIWVPPGT